jgi:hypothetical protein
VKQLTLAEDKANHGFWGMLFFAILFRALELTGATHAEWYAFVLTGIAAVLWEIGRKIKFGIPPDPWDVAFSISLPAVCMLVEVV